MPTRRKKRRKSARRKTKREKYLEKKLKETEAKLERLVSRRIEPETYTQRHRRLRISFKMETEHLLPRKNESMQAALENWAQRNGWTVQELWAEYDRVHGRKNYVYSRAA